MASGPRFYLPRSNAQNDLGLAVPGGLLNFYLTTSDTLAPTYANQALTVLNPNPVPASAEGVWPDIFLDPTLTYKVVYTDPSNGITPPHQYWTADPVKEAWPAAASDYFDIPFEFLGGHPPNANETMGMYTAVRPQRIFGNFDGTGEGYKKAWGNWMFPPTAEVDVLCYLNGTTSVGYMRIAATTGAVDFFTDGGLPIDLDASEFILWRGPAIAPTNLADGAWTITGRNL